MLTLSNYSAALTSKSKSKIVIYSIDYNEGLLRELPYHRYFEERSLCHLEILRQPNTRVILITSRPIDADILEYHFQELYQMNVKQERSARERLLLISPQSQQLVSLAKLVMEDTAILKTLAAEKKQADVIELINFTSSSQMDFLGQDLMIPVEEEPAVLSQYWGSKAGSKEAFLKSNVPTPRGTTRVFHNLDEIKNAAIKLITANSLSESVVIKLNEGNWADGLSSAVISCRKLLQTNALSQSLERILQPWESFVQEVTQGGAIVEEYVIGAVCSPSGQGYIDKRGEVEVISTHDQTLAKGKYVGCSYPATTQYLPQIYEAVRKVGKTLSAHGVRGTFGIDFIGFDKGKLLAIEINLRKVGNSHVFSYVNSVIANKIGSDGFLRNKNGLPIYYVNQWLDQSSLLTKYLEPKMAIERLRKNGLLYNHKTQTGTLLHILGALSPCGFVETTSIENSREKAVELARLVRTTLFDE
ncbi:MAG: L-propargylglycine--L-glutamate ligase [Chroococcidiopsis cubana SAG 39.79]|uniref:ATP-grasp domain-containing protein n=1 Tax=Chroococcidiopsis cubana SAG 39.79 TaxID=388085 RepID=A0AB37UIQ8_9CYAN|nr:peptide ligase PGM1-related protein [Chroococcidiopsis cubana]MDZ4877409.1 L-propargylglycine--L-glutamate ligase [Chroococcidiopsis cubana SAG 39.79]PSB64089.1 hypothetical protein C7B79_11225 [Chroococcidiopsis cubana CCALA 043]RUT11249.1 hypothetical protein DSM107010_35180 [Chroococcidiopsis cubana SAG 39.79]